MIDSSQYKSPNIGALLNLTINLGQSPITFDVSNFYTMTDSISLICGDGKGVTFCGSRILAIWDNISNDMDGDLVTSLFSLDPIAK